jgi:hypothetical protein
LWRANPPERDGTNEANRKTPATCRGFSIPPRQADSSRHRSSHAAANSIASVDQIKFAGCYTARMSEEEKALQIGQAVQTYHRAKVECASIEEKIERVFSSYLEAGASMDKSRGTISEPRIINGKLQLGWYSRERFSMDHLLNEEQLTALILERDAAREKLNEAKVAMNELGITSLS